MADSAYVAPCRLRDLAAKLNILTGAAPFLPGSPALDSADAIITHVEVCARHGVGKLVRMLFQGRPNILSIRSASYYGGRQEFGDLALCISHEKNRARDAVFSRVLDALGRTTVRRVLCIPYFADDVRTALAIKEAYGVPLCTYIMDDQNVCADGIPDSLMRELLAKSRLRLAISPELREAYSLKYGCAIGYMPPLAPAAAIPSRLVEPPAGADPRRGIIIGNIWGDRWLELLRRSVRYSPARLTWHCSGGAQWVRCDKKDLLADSIDARDPLPEDGLIQTLRKTWFAVVPSGTLDDSDDRLFIARLSLPSRIPYMMAVSQIPILVLGSPETAAARFVQQFGIGAVADYDRKSFTEAVEYIARPEVNLEMRRRALAISGRFSDDGAAEWIWRSLALGKPADRRYEDLAPAAAPTRQPL